MAIRIEEVLSMRCIERTLHSALGTAPLMSKSAGANQWPCGNDVRAGQLRRAHVTRKLRGLVNGAGLSRTSTDTTLMGQAISLCEFSRAVAQNSGEFHDCATLEHKQLFRYYFCSNSQLRPLVCCLPQISRQPGFSNLELSIW